MVASIDDNACEAIDGISRYNEVANNESRNLGGDGWCLSGAVVVIGGPNGKAGVSGLEGVGTNSGNMYKGGPPPYNLPIQSLHRHQLETTITKIKSITHSNAALVMLISSKITSTSFLSLTASSNPLVNSDRKKPA